MRLSPTRFGLLLSGVLSTFAFAQETDVSSQQGFDVIYAPAMQASSKLIIKNPLIATAKLSNRLVAVGSHGNIITRDLDSNTWKQANVPTSVLLTSVDFASDSIGYAAGHHGVILKTTDGGDTWQRIFDGFDLLDLEVAFYQQRIAELEQKIAAEGDESGDLQWALDDAKFYLENAQRAKQETGPSKPILDIKTLANGDVLAVGAYNTLLVSQDKGTTWQLISGRLDNPNGFHLNAIATQGDNVFIAGEAGTAYASRDNGESWLSVAPPYDGSLFGAHFDNQGRLWTYGLRGNIFVSDDLGERYTAIDSPADANLMSGYADTQGTQWIVGNSGVILAITPSLDVTEHTHPSSAVFGEMVEFNGEKVLTSRSGIYYWPAKTTQSETAEKGLE
ncbi:hypothetical protein BFR57_08480 [Idiomarina sp. MD25a]|uniref:WD40/YVTN/BNR-like repeat-containing protein n=1 Tax=Idiomarina sp. MD25a TaxID=1889913 RepID=UPI0008F8600F|nr:YCF48-related protein [Idiomarina sp. MD25a]OIN02076.1 hypothetical protein BFR57_08480 [Idiomarina sp. MD25a]